MAYGNNSIHFSSIFASPTFGTYFQGGSSRRGLKKAGTAEEADVDTPVVSASKFTAVPPERMARASPERAIAVVESVSSSPRRVKAR